MTSEREKMIKTLKEQVVPALRSRGFKGSFPHFRRVTNSGIHLLMFQFGWPGGYSFVVEIASCPLGGVTLPFGGAVPPSKVTVPHIDCRQRMRLRSGTKGDPWFKYHSPKMPSFRHKYESAAQEVLPLLDSQAEVFWGQSNAHKDGPNMTWDSRAYSPEST